MPISDRLNTNFYWYGDFSWRYVHGASDEFYYPKSVSIPVGSWGHFCVTYDGANVRIYRNGVFEGSKASTGTANFSNGFQIGNWASSSTYQYYGYIDDVRIYTTALSADDVMDLYETKGKIDKNGMFYYKDLEIPHNYDDEINNNNLVLNGGGEYGDLTGFSGFTGYDASEKAFYSTGSYNTVFLDDFIEIKGNGIDQFDEYVLEGEHKQPSGTMSRFYFMIVCYDKNFNFINNYNVTETTTAARTTLAQTLNNGDTILYLTSSANWNNDGNGVFNYQQQFAIFPDGFEYPDYTYSRIHGRYLSVSGNTLILETPWSGGTMAAGSRIMNTRDGGTFSYIAAGNQLMTTN
jgi:hypothetical protein